MDSKEFITWMARVDEHLSARAKEREEEKERRHKVQTQTANVIDKLRIEVMDIASDLSVTDSKVRTLEQIAASVEALLQGVMGRPGMVAQVEDHDGRLDRIEDLIKEVVDVSKSNGQAIEAQNREIKWMQRILYGAVGVMLVAQFIGFDGLKRLIFP